MAAGRIASVDISSGGVPKQPVFEATVGPLGLDGDRQNDTRHHGGPDRAVVLFSLGLIHALQREGHPIAAGTTGENLTVSGLDWASMVTGGTVRPGDAVRVTNVRS
jgi:MOSC domain-containing protein YiiM